jgi:DNA-binding Lrp family transcriptional regulator
MDHLDERIIEQLSTDGRKSYRDIARTLSVSLSTVSNRIKALEHQGVIRGYRAIVDPEKLGYTLTALINLKISRGKLIEVQQIIAKDPHVEAVFDITGDWDSLVRAHFKETRDLNTFIKRILTIPDVERTNTQLILNIVKDERLRR